MTASAPSLRFSRVGFDAPLDDSLYPRLSIETLTRFPPLSRPPLRLAGGEGEAHLRRPLRGCHPGCRHQVQDGQGDRRGLREG